MPRRDFINISLPDTGNAELNKALNAMRENIELLAALRGDASNHAVVKGDVETAYPQALTGDNTTDIENLHDTVRMLIADLKP